MLLKWSTCRSIDLQNCVCGADPVLAERERRLTGLCLWGNRSGSCSSGFRLSLASSSTGSAVGIPNKDLTYFRPEFICLVQTLAKCSLSLPKSKMFEKTDFSLLTMKQPLVKSRCSLCPESRDLTLLPLPALIKTQSNWLPDIERGKYLTSNSIAKVDQIKWSLS